MSKLKNNKRNKLKQIHGNIDQRDLIHNNPNSKLC